MAEILPECGLYQKIIHRIEKLLTGDRKLRPWLRKSVDSSLICG
jgi:hypothetical protein